MKAGFAVKQVKTQKISKKKHFYTMVNKRNVTKDNFKQGLKAQTGK